jgi:hypothetical protein
MKSRLSWQEYQKLELISDGLQHNQDKPSLGAKLNNFWQSVLAYFATSSEPCVWKTQDTADRTQWKAYDPVTKKSVCCDSEEELRAWLEERHYQFHLFAK